MGNGWLILLASLLVVTLVTLFFMWRRYKTQGFLIKLQSHEIEKQIRELKVQNNIQADLNREKKQLILLVSHDLKGPFNRIYALTQLLEMSTTNFTDEQRDYVNKMYQIVGDGLNMVRNLVDVRKIEERGLEPYPEKFNLTAILAPIIKQYKVLAEKKKITIELQMPDKLEMTTDKNYVCRIMENLLSNAIKFSAAETRVKVMISSDNNAVEIKVIDQGPGLGPEDLANLYQKFKKLTPRPTGGESSQGLGLSIVKQLANCMDGDVSCESQLEVGSTFTVKLPLVIIKKEPVS